MSQFLVFRDAEDRKILIDAFRISGLYEHPNRKDTFVYFDSHVLLVNGMLKDVWNLVEGNLEEDE